MTNPMERLEDKEMTSQKEEQEEKVVKQKR